MNKTYLHRISESKSSLYSDSANLARILFSVVSIIVGVLIMLMGFLVARDPEVDDPAIIKWQFAISQEILITIGTSIIASVVFYLLYTRSAEERVLHEIGSKASQTAADYALSLFKTQFEYLLPAKLYPETDIPLAEFNNDFDELLSQSNTYFFKGLTASYTSYRISKIAQNVRTVERDYKLLLADPREQLLYEGQVRVGISRASSSEKKLSRLDLTERANGMREKVYVTLVTIFDICHLLRVEVVFHKEHPFFRAEILDGGIFLTYYLGGKYPATYFYSRGTFSYEAYLMNFWQNYNALDNYVFDRKMNEEEFKCLLEELGCKTNVDQLRKIKQARFERYLQPKLK